MSEKKELIKERRIQVKGIFELEELYIHIHDWLEWHKYDVSEKKYKEKMTPGGKNIEIIWECTREIDEYSQFFIELKWILYGVNDMEVQQSGKKVKMQTGELNVYVSAYLVSDYQDTWEAKPMLKFLKSFYERYLYKGTLEDLKKELWNEAWALYNEAKAFLDLYKY